MSLYRNASVIDASLPLIHVTLTLKGGIKLTLFRPPPNLKNRSGLADVTQAIEMIPETTWAINNLNLQLSGLSSVDGKPVAAPFDGSMPSSNRGVLALAAAVATAKGQAHSVFPGNFEHSPGMRGKPKARPRRRTGPSGGTKRKRHLHGSACGLRAEQCLLIRGRTSSSSQAFRCWLIRLIVPTGSSPNSITSAFQRWHTCRWS